jgi:hypothetical protein
LAEASDGSPGAVLAGDPEEAAGLDDEVVRAWEGLGGQGVAGRFALSGRWAGEKDKLLVGRRLDALERHLRRRARQEATEGGGEALRGLQGVFRARRLLEQNVNTQLALDALFLGLLGRDEDDLV